MSEHEPTPSREHRALNDTPEEREDVWSRRSFVRYLAPISVAVPILVEGRTLVGLVREDFAGEDSAWSQPTGTAVGIGGDLRPDAPTEVTLRNAGLAAVDGGRQLRLSVGVRNTAGAPATFSLGAVTTDGGETVEGGETTDELAPGERATFTASYLLPSDATPDTVETTVTVGGSSSPKTVTLAPIPGAGE